MSPIRTYNIKVLIWSKTTNWGFPLNWTSTYCRALESQFVDYKQFKYFSIRVLKQKFGSGVFHRDKIIELGIDQTWCLSSISFLASSAELSLGRAAAPLSTHLQLRGVERIRGPRLVYQVYSLTQFTFVSFLTADTVLKHCSENSVYQARSRSAKIVQASKRALNP